MSEEVYNIKIFNHFDPELQMINTKPVIQNKLKDLLGDMKKFRQFQSQRIRKRRKISHLSTKLIVHDSDIKKHLDQ